MPGIQPVKGRRLRATKIDGCGRPVAGPKNRLVTSGYVTLTLTPVMRDAVDITQTNAEGKECFSDRTPPERRWYTPALELCNVNTGLLSMFTGWETLLDTTSTAVGFRDAKTIESDYGVALELWTTGKSDDDCAVIPILDSAAFSGAAVARQYGYFLFGGTEWTPGNITIGADVSTFTLTGRTIPLPYWGMGPYNVQADGAGAARRLITPMNNTQHLTAFRTPIDPPAVTPGTEPVALGTSTIFTAPNYYYGGPGNALPATVAPAQVDSVTRTVSITGGPTAGGFTLLVNGIATDTIAYNSTSAAALTVLGATDDGYTTAQWTVTGGALPGTPLVITPPVGAVLTIGTNSLTGGTTPTVVLT